MERGPAYDRLVGDLTASLFEDFRAARVFKLSEAAEVVQYRGVAERVARDLGWSVQSQVTRVPEGLLIEVAVTEVDPGSQQRFTASR